MTRVALVEPYLGGSHRAWADGYAEHSSLDVSVFGLPAINWKWRMQGAHVTIAEQMVGDARLDGPFDVLLCSDMVDVGGLLGLLRDRAGRPSVVLFMHENQLTFPLPQGERRDLTYAMTNWTSMLAADVVAFNSEHHRDDWFGALPGLLRAMPDVRHTALIEAVRHRSVVLPVGIDIAALTEPPRVRGPRPLVLWNQRWQWDKGPDRFVGAMVGLAESDDSFDIAVAGARGDDMPEHDRLRAALGERIVHDGLAPPDEYRRLLRSSDVVVSTARHEFFGVAVIEAMAAGAFPVLPDGLAYPEHVAAEHRAACLYDTERDLADRLEFAISDRDTAQRVADDLARSVERYDWPTVAAAYDALLR